MQRLLVVITDVQGAQQVVVRARQLAAQFRAELLLVRPVQAQLGEWQRFLPAGNFARLRDDILAAERQQFSAIRGQDPGEVLWCERVYRAVVDKATDWGADLILMQSSRQGVLESLLQHADDWHLLREAPCPVLLLPRVANPITEVIAAVDALAEGPEQELLAERVLDLASAFAHAHALPLTVVTVVTDPALIYASPVAVPLGSDLIGELTARARQAQQELLQRIGLQADAVRVATGRVEEVLADLAATGLLVIGSAANKGLKGLVLGNTAERILHRIATEMLVVN